MLCLLRRFVLTSRVLYLVFFIEILFGSLRTHLVSNTRFTVYLQVFVLLLAAADIAGFDGKPPDANAPSSSRWFFPRVSVFKFFFYTQLLHYYWTLPLCLKTDLLSSTLYVAWRFILIGRYCKYFCRSLIVSPCNSFELNCTYDV